MRYSWILLVLGVLGCESDPPTLRGAEVDRNGRIVAETEDGQRRAITLAGVDMPTWAPERDLFWPHVDAALRPLVVGAELEVDGPNDAATVRAGGRSINAEVVRTGWARAAAACEADVREAEAEARRERRGVWGEEGQGELWAWLGVMAEQVTLSPPAAPEHERIMRWEAARRRWASLFEGFELEVPTRPVGPPSCRDTLRSGATSDATAPLMERLRETFAGERVTGIEVQLPDDAGVRRLACREYTNTLGADGAGQLEARWTEGSQQVTETRTYRLMDEPPRLDLRSRSRETTGGGVSGGEGGSSDGPVEVSGAVEGGVDVFGMPWFTSPDACQRYVARVLAERPECIAR